MRPNYMLIADGQVVSKAKFPAALDYNTLKDCRNWSVCLKATNMPDDSGLYGCIAVVDWNTGNCRVILSDGVGCELPMSYCKGFDNIVSLVKTCLQNYHNNNKFDDYNDLPSIRVIPV